MAAALVLTHSAAPLGWAERRNIKTVGWDKNSLLILKKNLKKIIIMRDKGVKPPRGECCPVLQLLSTCWPLPSPSPNSAWSLPASSLQLIPVHGISLWSPYGQVGSALLAMLPQPLGHLIPAEQGTLKCPGFRVSTTEQHPKHLWVTSMILTPNAKHCNVPATRVKINSIPA